MSFWGLYACCMLFFGILQHYSSRICMLCVVWKEKEGFLQRWVGVIYPGDRGCFVLTTPNALTDSLDSLTAWRQPTSLETVGMEQYLMSHILGYLHKNIAAAWLSKSNRFQAFSPCLTRHRVIAGRGGWSLRSTWSCVRHKLNFVVQSVCDAPIINTSYQKLPFGSGDYPDKLLLHQALN